MNHTSGRVSERQGGAEGALGPAEGHSSGPKSTWGTRGLRASSKKRSDDTCSRKRTHTHTHVHANTNTNAQIHTHSHKCSYNPPKWDNPFPVLAAKVPMSRCYVQSPSPRQPPSHTYYYGTGVYNIEYSKHYLPVPSISSLHWIIIIINFLMQNDSLVCSQTHKETQRCTACVAPNHTKYKQNESF